MLCSRTALDQEDIAALEGIDRSDLDWERTLDLALYHRVFPLLHWNLKRHFPGLVPDTFGERLAAAFQANQQQIMGLTAELVRVAARLEDANVPSVVLKGPVLGAMAYGNFGLRPAGDLDLLVKPEHVSPAIETLRKCGYRLCAPKSNEELNVRQEQFVDRFHYHHLLIHEEYGYSIELHFRLFATKMLGFGPGAVEAIDRRSEHTIAGRKVGVLNETDNLIYLCVHGGKHAWARLEWIASAAELLGRVEDSNEVTLWDGAKARGAETALLLGVALAGKLFDLRALPELRKRASESPLVAKLAKRVITCLDDLKGAESFRASERHFQWRLCDGFRMRARWILFEYFLPHGAEFRRAQSGSRFPVLVSFWWVYRGLVRRFAKWVRDRFRKKNPD